MSKRVITAKALRDILVAIVDRRYPARPPEQILKLIDEAIPADADFGSDFHHDEFLVAKKESAA